MSIGRLASARIAALAAAGVLALGATPARAEEYRLRVANLLESAYLHYNHSDSRTIPGAVGRLEGLSGALDRHAVPTGSFVARAVTGADADSARPFAAVVAGAPPSLTRQGQWEEVVWQGRPGARSVWLVRGQTLEYPELKAAGLGTRPAAVLGNFLAMNATISSMRTRVLRVPGALVEGSEGRDGLWPKLARYMAPGEAVGVIVAVSRDLIHPDGVFVVIDQPAQPATFDVVLAWAPRSRFPNFWDGAGGAADSSEGGR